MKLYEVGITVKLTLLHPSFCEGCACLRYTSSTRRHCGLLDISPMTNYRLDDIENLRTWRLSECKELEAKHET